MSGFRYLSIECVLFWQSWRNFRDRGGECWQSKIRRHWKFSLSTDFIRNSIFIWSCSNYERMRNSSKWICYVRNSKRQFHWYVVDCNEVIHHSFIWCKPYLRYIASTLYNQIPSQYSMHICETLQHYYTHIENTIDTMNFALADILIHVKLNPLNTFVIRPILHLDWVCFVLHLYLNFFIQSIIYTKISSNLETLSLSLFLF